MDLPTKKIIIGKPCSPSKLVKIEDLSLIKIKLTYGGGMGGANRTLYVEEIQSETEKELVVKTFDNEIVTINKDYIVYREPIKAVLHVTDSTEHSNYHSKQVNSSVITSLYELSVNTNWEYDDKMNHDNPKPFYSHTERN